MTRQTKLKVLPPNKLPTRKSTHSTTNQNKNYIVRHKYKIQQIIIFPHTMTFYVSSENEWSNETMGYSNLN